MPGVGKTTLAHALAQVLGLNWQRVQFTSDLLPADILGVSVFDRATQKFEFRQGPVFTQLLLADEVNRASPRTQSALLEAMEERQVSVDGVTHALPDPFFVVATQNPHEQLGTYALPESQLDRFLMRIELGYPDAAPRTGAARRGGSSRAAAAARRPSWIRRHLLELQRTPQPCMSRRPLLDYVQQLVAATRARSDLRWGFRRAPRRDWCAPREPGPCSMAATPCSRTTCRPCGMPWRCIGWNRAMPRPRDATARDATGARDARIGAGAALRVLRHVPALPTASTLQAPDRLTALGAASPGPVTTLPLRLQAAPHLHPAHARRAGYSRLLMQSMFLGRHELRQRTGAAAHFLAGCASRSWP